MIVLKNVTKAFGKSLVLDCISAQIAPGEFVCVTGPSGAGKSTLIHLLTGAESITSGDIEVDGVDLRRVPFPAMQIYRRHIGVVFQDYKLLSDRTVRENIAFPLEVCGIKRVHITERVNTLLKKMELENKAGSLPSALSGGEKARTAIARAVVHEPMIILADEPTGNIDPVQSAKVMALLKQINASGATVVLATHDTALVDSLQKRVIRLEGGRIVRDSQGGYVPSTSSAPANPVQETVAVAEEVAMPSTPTPAPTGESAPRKIRITSIGS